MTPTPVAPLLASFEGRVPACPTWFSTALGHEPQRSEIDVQGTPIEMLSWGEIGRPGLLLLHGKMAHADWWRFIAPFFASTHRVVALSWSGMGGSGWRDTYSVETMADEAMAAARAGGLFENARKPVFVAHSFGAYAALLCAQHHGAQLGGLVTVDMPLLSREQRESRIGVHRPAIRVEVEPRSTRVYASLADALARFRFAPEQPCENLFIVDHIARTSLKQVPFESGDGMGWTWRFDPRVALLYPGRPGPNLRHATCPVAICWGAESALVDPATSAHVRSLMPPGTPGIEIPAARHHVMVDQPLAFLSALRGLLEAWPG